MATRIVEVFSAGCPCCTSAIEQVRSMVCPSCDLRVLDMSDAQVAERARSLGITRVPAVAVDGKVVECCNVPAISEDALRRAGVGVAA